MLSLLQKVSAALFVRILIRNVWLQENRRHMKIAMHIRVQAEEENQAAGKPNLS
jgi:hypothetical protein